MTNQINAPDPASLDVHFRPQVPPSRTRLALLVAFGLSVPLWWSVYVPPLLLGVAAGIIATQLFRASPLKGWAIFCGSLLLGACVEAVLTQVQPSESLASLFSGFGNLSFCAGSLVWPATNHFRKPG
jgi:hypothetical protein